MTPQSAIIPDHCLASLCIEAEIIHPEKIQTACNMALEALIQQQRLFSDDQLGMTIAFGARFWHSLGHTTEATELKDFRPLGNGLAPSTQCDLMIHIQSMRHDANFTLALQIVAAFGDAIKVKSETHGFRRNEERGLDGFIDGTENPQSEEDIARVGIINNDAPDAGGSYVLLQKYRHDLHKWNSYPISKQEESIGRSKAENIEFEGEQLHPNAHIARVNLKENGVGLKIVRRSMPYGQATGEHGLMFIAYCARLHNIEAQLLSMFGETADGQIDLLLERISTAVSGAYYFAPSIERLRAL